MFLSLVLARFCGEVVRSAKDFITSLYLLGRLSYTFYKCLFEVSLPQQQLMLRDYLYTRVQRRVSDV